MKKQTHRHISDKLQRETVSNKTKESVVTFNKGQTRVSSYQIPNVERIATYL